jgi:RTX calcium-binding nonapeptide repeat (4 copies)
MNLTLDEVKNKFIFLDEKDHDLAIADFTEEQKNIIKSYFDYLYKSDEAKIIFNKMNQIEESIRVFASNFFGGVNNLPSLGGNIFDPKPALFFDMGIFIDEYSEEFKQQAEIKEFKTGYISETGEFVEYDVRLAFMHELIHAITGLTDNDRKRGFSSRADSAGPTQDIANKIYADLNAPLRISYEGTGIFREPGETVAGSIEKGTQFTKGKIIGVQDNTIDIGAFVIGNVDTSSNSPVTKDLLISGGVGSDKTFKTGAGNDYLYGGGGNDTLDSGADNDYLNGGMGEDKAEFKDKFENYDIKTTGTTTKTTTITHKDNGTDGFDTLKGIEWGIFNGKPIDLGIA